MYTVQRIFFRLLGVAVIAAVIFLAVKTLKERTVEKEDDVPASAAAAVEEDPIVQSVLEYGTLLYSNGTATLSFATDDNGAWYWTDEPDFPLRQSFVAQILNTISSLKPQQTLSPAEELETYGLAQPAMRITTVSGTEERENGKKGQRTETEAKTLYIGNQVKGDSGSYYLYIDGEPETVYIVPDTLIGQISRGIYDMMDLPEPEDIPEDAFKAITIHGPSVHSEEGEVKPGPSWVLTPYLTAGGVAWRIGGDNVTGNPLVNSLIALMRELEMDRCVDYNPSGEAVTLCGLDDPAVSIFARYADEEGEEQIRSLTVGSVTLDGGSRYVRLNDDSTIYALSTETLSPLMTAAEAGLDHLPAA